MKTVVGEPRSVAYITSKISANGRYEYRCTHCNRPVQWHSKTGRGVHAMGSMVICREPLPDE